MSDATTFILHAMVIGTGATAVLDLRTMLQKRFFSVSSLDFRMVGRWLGHLPSGRFRHDNIAAAAPVRGESPLGWTARYAIGVAFAALRLGARGVVWARDPSLAPALIVGLITLVAPFFVLQPALGAGIAASRTPHPNAARLRSLIAHLCFGLGLHLTAEAWVLVG